MDGSRVLLDFWVYFRIQLTSTPSEGKLAKKIKIFIYYLQVCSLLMFLVRTGSSFKRQVSSSSWLEIMYLIFPTIVCFSIVCTLNVNVTRSRFVVFYCSGNVTQLALT